MRIVYRYEDTLRLLGMRLNREQHRAFQYLERAGMRFCCEFGISNAVEVARDHWRAQKRKKRKP